MRTKAMVTVKKILRYLLGVILLTLLSVIVLCQLPSLQTYLAQKTVEKVQDKVDGKIEIESVHLKFINTIVIKGLSITDLNPPAEDAYDTLIRIGSLGIRFSVLSLLSHGCVSLKSVKIKDARMNLVIKHEGIYENNLTRIFHIPPKDTTRRMTTKPLIYIGKVEAENMEYGMRNYSTRSKAKHPWNVDWTDVDVKNIHLLATDFNIRDAHFTGSLHELSFKEKSGWQVEELSCEFSVGQGEVKLSDAHLRDTFGSDMDFDYKMSGRSSVYKSFITKVKMDGVFKKSRVSMSTLARVVPPMYPDSTTFATLTGHAHGTVSDLHGESLKLGFENNCVRATVDGRVSGLPDISAFRIDSRISDINFNTADLTKLLVSIAPKKKIDLRRFGKGCVYHGDVSTDGLLNEIKADVALSQFKSGENMGDLTLNLKLDNVIAHKATPLSVCGHICTENLDLDPIMGKKTANDITLSTKVNLQLPGKHTELQATLDSMSIENVRYNGYGYRNITGSAVLNGKDLDAVLHARDSALRADITLWTDETDYNADIDVKVANLHKMNFDSRKISIVCCDVKASADKNLSEPQGNAIISGIRLCDETGVHRIDDIKVAAGLNYGNYDITLTAGQTVGEFRGNKKIFNADLILGETIELLSFIKPGLYVEKGTAISARRDSTGWIHGTMKSGRIALKKNYLKDLTADVSGPLDSLSAKIHSNDIFAAGFHFQNSALDANFVNSLLSLKYNYSSYENDRFYQGNLNGSVLFNQDKSMEIKIEPSNFVLDNEHWDLKESSVKIADKDISIDNFMLSSVDQFLKLDGGMQAQVRDTLSANIHNIDMSSINLWIKDKDFGLQGILNAEGRIISPRITDQQLLSGLPRIELKLAADSVKIKGQDYGHLEALCEYEHDMKRFRVDISDDIGDKRTLSSTLYYSPKTKDLDLVASLDRFPFGFISAFTEKIFSGLDGYATADVNITKKNGVLDLSCKEGRIDKGMLEIAFTNVPYYIDGTFAMDNSGVHFKEMLIRDRAQGTGVAKGGVKWNRMKDMQMDMHLIVKNIEALNIPSNVSGLKFYGNVTASGIVDMTGPMTNMLLKADAKTTGPSNMHFMVSGDMDATKGELLTFVDPFIKEIDPYIKMMQEKHEVAKSQSGMKIKIMVDADQNLKANLDMTGTGFAAGAIGRGKGMIDLDVDTRTQSFSILGDYRLEEGIFDFNASDIVHRQFTIKDGSLIKFCGDIPATELSIEADYQTKASISPLISDTTSVSNRRLVQCGIKINNKLTDPSLSFSIKIPDLDPSTQAAVESALNTEAKVQKQFLSILVGNSFLPNEENGIVNNSTILYSNVSELMATQINNIFAKLDIPLDFGLNYQPTDKGANLFDVALSTQLWNNRVIIGGSLGNRQSTNSTGTTIFGDLDIEYKVTKNGALRVKAFSHAADQYSNYLDQSQRNGIGATWQQEFDTFRLWWKLLFMKKEQRLKYQEEHFKDYKATKKLTLDE